MKTLKFKTNIKCGGCIATASPFLDAIPEITKWEVDTQNPEKILSLEVAEELNASTIVSTLEKAGFTASAV